MHNSHGTTTQSWQNQNDYVLGICLDDDKAYVGGLMTSKLEGPTSADGFILKVDTD